MTERLRVFSFGGGVQSTAALVLAAQGRIDYKAMLFANVGNDSEHPKTLEYVHNIAMPFAAKHGIQLEELRRTRRDGTTETLLDRLVYGSQKSIGIPVRMGGSGAPGRRQCTVDFKIRVINKWVKKNGGSKTNPALVGIGISLDEFHRMRTSSGEPERELDYPLIALRLNRGDCERIIADAGLSVPPKSSCWFCPYRTKGVWQKMRHEEPDLFQKSVELEAMLSARHEALGRGPVYLASGQKTLPMATSAHRQLSLLEGTDAEDGCVSGHCMT